MSLSPEISIYSHFFRPICLEVAVGSVCSQRSVAPGTLIGLASYKLEDLVGLAVHDNGHGFDIDITVVDGRPDSWRVFRFFFELVYLIKNSNAVHGANWIEFPIHQLDKVWVVDIFEINQDLGLALLFLVN